VASHSRFAGHPPYFPITLSSPPLGERIKERGIYGAWQAFSVFR
jgi:hypothetical protein